MKTLIFSLLVILISITVSGQKPYNTISILDKEFNDYYMNKSNIPVVKGRVINIPADNDFMIPVNYSLVTPFEELQVNKSSQLNPDGTFELQLEHALPYQQIWLRIGPLFYAGIYAHKDLYIELDADSIFAVRGVTFNGPGVKYMGTDGELNAYMNNFILFKRERQLELSSAISELSRSNLSYDDYKSKYDSLFNLRHALINEYINQNPSEYSWIIQNETQSDYLGGLCVKHWSKGEMNPELLDEVMTHKPLLTSNDGMGFYNYLFTYLTSGTRNFKSLENYRSYSKLGPDDKVLLDSFVQMEKDISNSLPYDTLEIQSMVMRLITILHDTLVTESTLKTLYLLDEVFEESKADYFKTKIHSKDLNEQMINIPLVLDHIHTPWCKEVVRRRYETELEKFASVNRILQDSKPFVSDFSFGEPLSEMPSGAKLFRVSEMQAEALLSTLKNSFTNKAILIDFWATWCGPCLHEMPYSKKLHEDTRDLPLEFIYLYTSNNSSIDKWKSTIAESGIGGIHIYVDHGIIVGLMDLFSVSGFPSYVFINSRGDYMPGAISRMAYLDKEKLTKLIE